MRVSRSPFNEMKFVSVNLLSFWRSSFTSLCVLPIGGIAMMCTIWKRCKEDGLLSVFGKSFRSKS